MRRDWSNIPRTTFLGALLRLPLRAIPHGTVVTVRSGLNKGLRWIVGSSIHGCWLGTYELEKQSAIQRLVKPGMKVFDIGANAGFYTLAFSRLVGADGHVWAFEPLAENAANILRHLNLNQLRNVTLIQAAVASHDHVVGFSVGQSNAVGSIDGDATGYKVPAVALDTLVAAGVVPIPDVIKIDVEGAESMVLNGATDILRHKQTALLVALHSEHEQGKCGAFLTSSGYTLHFLDGRDSADILKTGEIYATPSGR